MKLILLSLDTCSPMNHANSFYFQPMADAIASFGYGYKMPSYHALRSTLLEDMKKEVTLLVDSYRNCWAETGCTIMADGWKDMRQRSLVNFLVSCPKGIVFIKSVDVSDVLANAENLCNLFVEIVENVGPDNVVQLITDNAANYKAAGRKLNERYLSIVWTPCAAHCVNLMLGDIGKMDHVQSLVKRASMITVFVYNHKWTLSWLRNREGWSEILRPGETRFATTFIALQSLYEHKLNLQAMVVSREYIEWAGSKTVKAKRVEEIILDGSFWTESLRIVKIISPLVKLLRIMDSDEKPAMPYVYEGIFRARKAIRETFNHNRRLYEPYIKILDERWDNQMRQDIHCAAYWLNPAFHWEAENHIFDDALFGGFLSYVGGYDPKHEEFTERKGSFGGEHAKNAIKTARPDHWWRNWGHSNPTLRKLAIRILSQTASSSGCERNWSVFERIHTKRRNRLEHQRLNDLVFVHYNLRLKNRASNKKISSDPIDYECIDDIENWILEDVSEPEPDMNLNDLDNMEAQAAQNDEPNIGSSSNPGDRMEDDFDLDNE